MNQLTVSLQHSIATLAARGWSARKIARELDVDRETVRRYLPGTGSKPAILPTGSCDPCAPKPAILPAGSKGAEAVNVPRFRQLRLYGPLEPFEKETALMRWHPKSDL